MSRIEHKIIRTTKEEEFIDQLNKLVKNCKIGNKEYYRIEKIDKFAVPYQYTTEFIAIIVLEVY